MARPFRMRTRWSPLAVAGFEAVFRPWMTRHLRAMHLTGLPADQPTDRPLLLVANHVSWWDGFVLREVQRALLPAAPLYTTMTGAELRRFPFFRLLGALDVGPRSPSVLLGALRFLVAQRRREPGLVVSIFPQGRLWPARRRPLGFQRGVSTLARLLAPVTVLPVGLDYQLFASPSPSAFVSVGEPLHVRRELDLGAIEQAVARELDRVDDFLAAHGEQAPRAWPGVAGRLPSRADRSSLDPTTLDAIAHLPFVGPGPDEPRSSGRRGRRPRWPRSLPDA